MAATNSLAERVREAVHRLFLEKLAPAFVYHNYAHAEEVAEVSKKLADEAGLSQEDQEVLLAAAWLFCTGYTQGSEDWCARSQAIAGELLTELGATEEQIDQVQGLIASTQEGAEPAYLLEKIFHDARFAFLGRKRFARRSQLLRVEKEAVSDEKYTLYRWNQKMLSLQLDTKFYTPWAAAKYHKQRAVNIAKQQESLRSARKVAIRKKTGKDFGRGVDTVYRTTLRNHINLSSIADGKANMIISINTLVLSILITAASASYGMSSDYFSEHQRFIVPVLLLMLTSLLAITFAVLSAIPKVSGRNFDEKDVRKHKLSLLYFGNFLKMPKEDFVDYLRELKHDQEILYDDLSRDLYNLGSVLKKKYRLLTWSYWVFVIGLVLSFLAFAVGLFLL